MVATVHFAIMQILKPQPTNFLWLPFWAICSLNQCMDLQPCLSLVQNDYTESGLVLFCFTVEKLI